MIRATAFCIAFIAALLLGGCVTSAPIQDVRDAPVVVASGKPVTATEVGKAIERAAEDLGWKLSADAPGHFTGRLLLRSHIAVVAIEYSPKTYSILYRDSVNLDEKGGEIHRNYNQWIDNLDRAIRVQLEKL